MLEIRLQVPFVGIEDVVQSGEALRCGLGRARACVDEPLSAYRLDRCLVYERCGRQGA